MAASAPAKVIGRSERGASRFISQNLRNHVGNVFVALTFFLSALPNARYLERGPANAIWVGGAIIMGVLSLVRFPPRAVMTDARALASTLGVFLLPCLVRPAAASAGILAAMGIAVELAGVILSQVARLYMGRSFGILPGNRGIVSNGPFRLIRHPIYAGWFLLTLGYLLAYPSWRNSLLMLATIPFMIWRIRLEEELLARDTEYREYEQRVHFRLLPGVF